VTARAMPTLRTTTSRNERVVNARWTLSIVSSLVASPVNPSVRKKALTTSSTSEAM
jgi:hypothetical protein